MSSSTTTPTAAAPRAPSTRTAATVEIGDVVLVLLDQGIRRPLLVSAAGLVTIHERATPTPDAQSRIEFRVSGTLFCEPDDHTRPALRGWSAGGTDPARIHGHPDRLLPLAYGEALAEGSGIGQWIPRPLRGR